MLDGLTLSLAAADQLRQWPPAPMSEAPMPGVLQSLMQLGYTTTMMPSTLRAAAVAKSQNTPGFAELTMQALANDTATSALVAALAAEARAARTATADPAARSSRIPDVGSALNIGTLARAQALAAIPPAPAGAAAATPAPAAASSNGTVNGTQAPHKPLHPAVVDIDTLNPTDEMYCRTALFPSQ